MLFLFYRGWGDVCNCGSDDELLNDGFGLLSLPTAVMTVPGVNPSQQLTMTAAPFPIRYAEPEYWDGKFTLLSQNSSCCVCHALDQWRARACQVHQQELPP